MDSMWMIIGLAVLVLLGLYFFRRSRPAPQGTYDDKSVRSSGSIGGGTRAYDSPDHRSSGSIGGEQRGVDSPAHRSGGSIGGDSVVTREELETDKEIRRNERRSDEIRSGETGTRDSNGNRRVLPSLLEDEDEEKDVSRSGSASDRRRYDDDKHRSGGSFGG